jgi:hypothetical protein
MAPTTTPATPVVTPAAPPVPAFLGLLVGGCVVLVFFMLLPAGFFWFYKRPSVQQTLDYFDPKPSWTDKCPTPVLAVSLWLVAGAVITLTYIAYGIFPAFGVLLTGTPAIAMLAAWAVVQALLAWGNYRVSPAAWWGTTLFVLVSAVGVLMTYARIDPMDFYRAAGSTPEQIELMQAMGVVRRTTMIVPVVFYGVAALAYLLWVRRFFARPAVAA